VNRALHLILPLLLTAPVFGADEPAEIEQQLRRFAEVYSVIEQFSADPVDPQTVFYSGAIPGMLARLDPHSVFLDPEQFLQLQALQNSTQKGFGSVVSVMPGRVIVLQTVPGTPSARAGLEPGDEILSINGVQLSRLGVNQLRALLTDARQHEVKLNALKRGDRGVVQVVMTPADVEAPSVDLVIRIRPTVGYVRIRSFEVDTASLVAKSVEAQGGHNLGALVLDLRGNPGGILDAGIECASLFLPPGAAIVSLRGRGGTVEEIITPEGGTPYEFPVAVLIDERTASAAEIMTGALQDHGRAIVVGQRSYGKGLVQSVYPLSEGAAIALTTALYYTPNGRYIQRPIPGSHLGGIDGDNGGIPPDVVSQPMALTRLGIALEATGAFPRFATELLGDVGDIGEDYEVPSAVVDRFRRFLYAQNIQPGVSQWSVDADWIRSRLRQEILNQAVSVAAGDEVEIQRDPEVRTALEALGFH